MMKGRTNRTFVAWVAGITLWILLPVAIFVYLTSASAQVPLVGYHAVWSPVRSNDQPVSTTVQLNLQWNDNLSLVAPAWSGVVQGVDIPVDGVVKSGDPIAVVGGITRLAFHSSVPFSGTIAQNSTGVEVESLNTLLRKRGLPAGTTQYNSATTRGVELLAKQLGVPNAVHGISFDPGWIVYLGSAQVHVTTIHLSIGSPAPPQGTVIGKVPSTIASAYISSVPTNPAIAPTKLSAKSTETLTVSDTPVGLNPDHSTVSSAGLATLLPLVKVDAPTIQAALNSPPTTGEWTLPSSAVFTGANGGLCVRARDAGKQRSVPVSLAGQGFGTVTVRAHLSARESVLLNVPQSDRSCG
jgi:hypothetical protein